MKIIIDNVQSRLVIGGRDHLCDPNLISTLREYLSIDVPGSYFANKYLKYHWNGKKYFLTEKTKVFATGFLSVLLKYIEKVYPDLDVEIIDERGYIPGFKEEFVSQIGPLSINNEYIHLKELIQAFNNYLDFRGQKIYFPRGICDAATNAGKTTVMAGLYLNLKSKERMLVVIHKKTVFAQLVAFFESVFGEVGQINDKEYSIRPVTVAMIQTLFRRINNINIRKDLAQFTILVIDESHLSGSDMYAKTLVYCNAPIRMGASGTSMDSNDTASKMITVGLLGPKLKSITKKILMDKGISVPVKVHMHLCNTILHYPVLDYNDCIKTLIHQSTERVFIMSQIIKDRLGIGTILIPVDKIEHGEFLYNYLNELGIPVDLTHSKDKEIMSKLGLFKAGQIKVLIATSVIREGINMPLIQTIIYAAGGEPKIWVKQWMGRGERKSESKTEFEFHDFYDIGRFVNAHSRKRLKIYQSEQLEIITHYDSKEVKNMHSVVIR